MSNELESSPDGTRLVIPYAPRQQFIPFHARNQRFACMVAHRRAGKTVACVNDIVAKAARSRKKRPRYAYIGPQLKQSKKIAWAYLKEYSEGLVGKKPSESELSVVLKHNGAELGIYGADNPDSFRGQYFDGVVLDEYGDMSPSVWGKVLLPTLADRKGWAIFIGTFKGKNHFYRIHRRAQGLDLPHGEDPEAWRARWFHYLLKASVSGILPESELALARSEMEEEEYEQEYECNPNAAIRGTYYAKEISRLEHKGQIYSLNATYDPLFPVDVFSDLGIRDSTVLIFIQRRADGFAILDVYENHGQRLSHYFDIMASKPFAYGRIFLPHDARAATLQTGVSTVELSLDLAKGLRPFSPGSRLIDTCPKLDLQDGINATRAILPSCYFNHATEDLVEALRFYRRKWDEDNMVFVDEPDHDWSSHYADAFRYFAITNRTVSDRKPVEEDKPRIVVPTNPQLTLDMLYKQRESRRFGGRRI